MDLLLVTKEFKTVINHFVYQLFAHGLVIPMKRWSFVLSRKLGVRKSQVSVVTTQPNSSSSKTIVKPSACLSLFFSQRRYPHSPTVSSITRSTYTSRWSATSFHSIAVKNQHYLFLSYHHLPTAPPELLLSVSVIPRCDYSFSISSSSVPSSDGFPGFSHHYAQGIAMASYISALVI